MKYYWVVVVVALLACSLSAYGALSEEEFEREFFKAFPRANRNGICLVLCLFVSYFLFTLLRSEQQDFVKAKNNLFFFILSL